MSNPHLKQLHAYPFQKLKESHQGITPKASLDPIALSIGEPKHQPPSFVLDTLTQAIDKVSLYPNTKGLAELRESISRWASQRFALAPDLLSAERHVLPVNGTREALFAFTQAIIDTQQQPLVISPNPFYQIYEGASILANAELKLLNCAADTNYLPDFSQVSEQEWQRCQLVFLCSPGNPTGALLNLDNYQQLIELADRYNFIIASDECYSELYRDESAPPPGLLQACVQLGRDNFSRCVVFHSLSKRSNLPGLRSGFVAGDADILEQFLLYRTYHGCAMPIPTQLASIAAWNDEQHVIDNRQYYREKYQEVGNILADTWPIKAPPASFYLWAPTPINDVEFAKKLYTEQHITVLPGSFLSRRVNGVNPGENYVRMALVAPLKECREAAYRLKTFMQQFA